MNALAFVTDDNAVNRKLARAFLQRLGWSIEEFSDAASMLARLESAKPSIILLDISMPGMSGTEACEQIRRNPALNAVRIIAYTAHAMTQDREQFLASGFDDVLIKPVSLAAMSQTMGMPGASGSRSA